MPGGDKLKIQHICAGYSITFKAFGILTNGKWYFMEPSVGKMV